MFSYPAEGCQSPSGHGPQGDAGDWESGMGIGNEGCDLIYFKIKFPLRETGKGTERERKREREREREGGRVEGGEREK